MKKTQLSKVQKIIQEEFSHIINNKPVNENADSLEMLKLFNKVLKAFPNSPRQK